MKLTCLCAILLSTSLIASAQDIQIQALPQTVNYGENDLVIVCTISNPSQLSTVFFIQLLKNSSGTFDTVVSVATGQPVSIQWKDSALQRRATAIGNLDSPSSAQLRLTIDKANVLCPADFKMYLCKMSGLTTASDVVSIETSPITISYTVKPTLMEIPSVRILNDGYDTPDRQFPVETAIQLTCQGEVGSDQTKTIRWCAQRATEMMFTGLPQTPIHSEASPSGCQFTRSSTITYNLTNDDTFTKFLCESGDYGLCGTGTAIRYVNISITEESSTINTSTANGESQTNDTNTSKGTSTAGNIAGGMIKITVGFLFIILV